MPFGCDSLITAWLLLDIDPDLSRSVLRYPAARQGRKADPYRDEEPGKIMHEHRESEINRIGELPFATYYGSADLTPLFILLLGNYVERTGDVALARELEPTGAPRSAGSTPIATRAASTTLASAATARA